MERPHNPEKLVWLCSIHGGDFPVSGKSFSWCRIAQDDMDPTLSFEATTSRTILNSGRLGRISNPLYHPPVILLMTLLRYHDITTVVSIKGFEKEKRWGISFSMVGRIH